MASSATPRSSTTTTRSAWKLASASSRRPCASSASSPSSRRSRAASTGRRLARGRLRWAVSPSRRCHNRRNPHARYDTGEALDDDGPYPAAGAVRPRCGLAVPGVSGRRPAVRVGARGRAVVDAGGERRRRPRRVAAAMAHALDRATAGARRRVRHGARVHEPRLLPRDRQAAAGDRGCDRVLRSGGGRRARLAHAARPDRTGSRGARRAAARGRAHLRQPGRRGVGADRRRAVGCLHRARPPGRIGPRHPSPGRPRRRHGARRDRARAVPRVQGACRR